MIEEKRVFWPKVKAQALKMFSDGKGISEIAAAVGLHHATVRARLRDLGLVKSDPPPKWTVEICQKPGLPPGHLKPWPASARFDSLTFTSGGVAKIIRPEPTCSNGVAEYGT